MTRAAYFRLIFMCERYRGNGRLRAAWIAFNQARRAPEF